MEPLDSLVPINSQDMTPKDYDFKIDCGPPRKEKNIKAQPP